MTSELQLKPKQVTKKLLSVLPDRAREIITSRYGLGKNTSRMTLEAIGKIYGITRERVRQIENYALNNIRKSEIYKQEKNSFDELEQLLHSLGGIVLEDDLLNHLSKDKNIQNHLNLLLVLGEAFKREKEDDEFRHRWHVNEKLAKDVHEALRKLYTGLTDKDLIPESEIVSTFLEHLKDVSEKYKNQEIVRRWLGISKNIGKNPLGEWGISSSPNIKTKGMRDYAFLVIRKHGSPIHFKEVAKSIEQIFKKKAHVATCHNELIKDPRFVLVGRGLYALSEWGYMSGVVKDVIRKILEKTGPLNKEEIIEKVLKERYVKENTIMVNLQNPKFFLKSKDGKYSIIQNKEKVV
ncbi:MAG: sigma factor-like helix-turn-helix DNA-binding protein [Patescibacteria group bacterium]